MPDLQAEVRRRVNVSVPDLPTEEDPADGDTQPAAARAAVSNRPLITAHAHSTFVNQADAPMCPNCGQMTVRNGACYKCNNCGESLGCS
jgi:ribonucleoside-diphosphate reductase alpha chain